MEENLGILGKKNPEKSGKIWSVLDKILRKIGEFFSYFWDFSLFLIIIGENFGIFGIFFQKRRKISGIFLE